jgi:hypothetical protein
VASPLPEDEESRNQTALTEAACVGRRARMQGRMELFDGLAYGASLEHRFDGGPRDDGP